MYDTQNLEVDHCEKGDMENLSVTFIFLLKF